MVTALGARVVPFAASLVAGVTLALVVPSSAPGSSAAARAIALGALVASALAALLPRRADVRAHASVSLAVASMVATAQAPHRATFMVMSVPFLLACVLTLRAPRRALLARTAHAPGATGARRAAFILVAVGTAVASLLVLSLPPAARVVEARLEEVLSSRLEAVAAVGFSSRMRLGSTRGMLASDRVVLRLEGAAPELLRGAVYDHYEGRVWTSSRDAERAPLDATLSPPATTRVALARGTHLPGGREARFFLPAGTCRVGTPSGRAVVDPFGVVRPAPLEPAERIVADVRADGAWTAGCAGGLAPAPPSPEDVDMPPRLRRELAPIAEAWSVTARRDSETVDLAPGELLDRFARRLRTFGYSLSVARAPHVDPIVDLLTTNEAGHCEMFAAALVLLARTRGIPARVVTGYRVSERNPLTGRAVVRERNAHAWAEAWVGGRWATLDPTPSSELARRPQPTWLDHVSDAWNTYVDRAYGAASHADPVRVALLFVVAAAVVVALPRLQSAVRSRRLGARPSSGPPALPAFVLLESALATAGHVREPSEPLERFAGRLSSGGEPWGEAAAAALRRYAALRYGGRGEERDVSRDLDEAARRITASARRADAP